MPFLASYAVSVILTNTGILREYEKNTQQTAAPSILPQIGQQMVFKFAKNSKFKFAYEHYKSYGEASRHRSFNRSNIAGNQSTVQ